MCICRCRRLLFLPALVVLGTMGAFAQERPLEPMIEGEAAPGLPQAYAITVKAGDLISGTLELVRGGAIGFEVFAPGGTKIKDVHVDEPAKATVGFVASVTGAYRATFPGALLALLAPRKP